ncbi:MAG: DNA alkylation repair protein [Prosthecobacter sp.]
MTLTHLHQQLRAQASSERAAVSQSFFKTGPGQYGEGDKFFGLSVPQIRAMVPETDDLAEANLLTLLHSKWHEERLLALLILVRRFEKSKQDEKTQAHIVDLYLANTEWINNWDLVDTSAPYILGKWLLTRDRAILKKLASSQSLWEQRIAVLATQTFIRAGEFGDTIRLCESFLTHPHDLMHKACGWMLREVGKRDASVLRSFLDKHAMNMPRTMLRYAIEKLPEAERRQYMGK